MDDRLNAAVQCVASRMMRMVVEASVDDLMDFWGDHLDEIGEYDAASIAMEMRRLAEKIDVSDFAFETSLAFLESRTTDKEVV